MFVSAKIEDVELWHSELSSPLSDIEAEIDDLQSPPHLSRYEFIHYY
jgi:hypothetical protein